MNLRDLNYPFIVATPSYFEELGPILAKTDNQVLNAYFIWHLILNYVDVLGESVKKGMDEYKEKVLGISPTSLPPRYETCLKYVDKLLGFAAGKFFIDKKFGGESKNVAEGMIQGVIDAFIARINALEWLDEKTSVAAIEKMTALIQKIGFPDFVTSPEKLWDYYAELNIIQSDFFGNVYRHNYVNVKRDWNKLSKKTDKQKWEMFPQTVNAYYNPLVNEIVFPAGILQAPFFNAEVPGYLNYGGIGLVMGHEASHGVDNMGRHYDSKGRLRDWWSPHTNAEFEKRSQCFIEQYSSYYINDAEGRKVHVNGKLTLGENLADNGGLRQSWTAWKNSTSIQHKKETKLPGLLSYSPEQLFFVNFAQVWCSKYKPQYALQSIRVDPHSPPFVRVNAAVQNSPDFARVFNCPAKSPMNPEKKCSIW
ncbi:hypothetical protein BKA69DRAFT_1109677 [Paraphysoderma sedebokerense]|nr:hypothetical protein BKA69DRAFT_1109677 [Paraphysoderma sedebokerense]